MNIQTTEELRHLIEGVVVKAMLSNRRSTEPKPVHGKSGEVIEHLQDGYKAIAELSNLTGLEANRIHMIISYIKSRGYKVRSKTIKQYTITKA